MFFWTPTRCYYCEKTLWEKIESNIRCNFYPQDEQNSGTNDTSYPGTNVSWSDKAERKVAYGSQCLGWLLGRNGIWTGNKSSVTRD